MTDNSDNRIKGLGGFLNGKGISKDLNLKREAKNLNLLGLAACIFIFLRYAFVESDWITGIVVVFAISIVFTFFSNILLGLGELIESNKSLVEMKKTEISLVKTKQEAITQAANAVENK